MIARSLLLLLLLSALVPLLSAQQEAAAPAVEPRFAWTLPARARVIEETLKKGQTAEMAYLMEARLSADGKRIEVRLTDFEFRKIAGRDATTPAMKKALAQATKMAALVPVLHVTKDGSVEGFGDMSELIDGVIAFMGKTKGTTPAEDARMRKMMNSPQMISVLQQSAAHFWGAWVGGWRLDELPAAGTQGEYEEIRKMPDGSELKGRFVVRNLGPSKEHPGHLRLSRSDVMEGEAARKAMGALLGGLVKQVAGSQDAGRVFAEGAFEASMRLDLAVVTDPKTLRPVRATSEKIVKVRYEGESREQVERHRYRFEWLAPQKR